MQEVYWGNFIKTFQPARQGKHYTIRIEGNSCHLRHRIKWAIRKTCRFF